MLTYIALDPGYSTGYATFDENGDTITWGTVKGEDELIDFLDSLESNPTGVIVEEFKLFKHRAIQQSGSRMVASQMIGIIKVYAKKWKADYTEQPAQIKKIAELYSGVKPHGDHSNSHWVDALNHGIYYLVTHNIRKPRALEDLEKNEGVH